MCLPARLTELRDCKGALRAHLYGTGGDQHPYGVVFFAPRGLELKDGEGGLAALPSTESNELGLSSEKAIQLDQHCSDVHAWAEGFAVRAGLPQGQCGDVALAALLHDCGKADHRFQAFLMGGDPYGQDMAKPLAKSGRPRLPDGAWERAGLPPHWRHEALSVRLAIAAPEFKQAHDPRLVLWLIGAHHGHGRPLYPHADPKEHGPQSLAFDFEGLDWAQIFEALKEKYGIWGLARLEAFVRLADHRASEAAAQERKEAAE